MLLSYRRAVLLRAALALGCLLLTAAQAGAQAAPDADNAAETLTETPRAALTRFFELARSGDYQEAAKFLELPPELDPARAPELAKRLKLVLDHHRWLDFSKVSAASSGNLNDGLSPGVEEITRLPLGRSLSWPVRLVHRPNVEVRWLFSRNSVLRVDQWYKELPNRFWLDLSPEPLLRMGPRNLLWGQWVVLPLFLLVVWFAGVSLSRLSRTLFAPLARRTSAKWDEALLTRIASPLAMAFGLLAAQLLLPALGLYPPPHRFAERSLRALLFATFFWGLARSVDVGGQLLSSSQWGTGAPATRAMLLFGSRVAKTVIAAFALVALFSELGYPVTSLLAGLGVGGIAVALSAQKSLENLIGAFAIAVDQPFREGDFVRVDNMLGTVELIGMRSTRIRTPDRTLVSIPNGKLADMRIETFAARDRIRLGFSFGLTYDTTADQLHAVVDGFEGLLRAHPKIWPEGCVVRFRELGESALWIEVGCWFATADFDEFTVIRQDVLIGLMKLVEQSGARFAFPTRTLQLDAPVAVRETGDEGDVPRLSGRQRVEQTKPRA